MRQTKRVKTKGKKKKPSNSKTKAMIGFAYTIEWTAEYLHGNIEEDKEALVLEQSRLWNRLPFVGVK